MTCSGYPGALQERKGSVSVEHARAVAPLSSSTSSSSVLCASKNHPFTLRLTVPVLHGALCTVVLQAGKGQVVLWISPVLLNQEVLSAEALVCLFSH